MMEIVLAISTSLVRMMT